MPLLHLLAGPHGAGKSSYVRVVLNATTGPAFSNADEIDASLWPEGQSTQAYEAARIEHCGRISDRFAAPADVDTGSAARGSARIISRQ